VNDESYNEESELWKYIGRWYNHLFTEDERFGPTAQRLRELVPDASPSDIKAILTERHGGKGESLPVVRQLQHEVDKLTRRTMDRICREHTDELFINRCPECGRIVVSPTAKQCLWCGNDWH